jgi:hypothetical protein
MSKFWQTIKKTSERRKEGEDINVKKNKKKKYLE